MHFLNSFTIFGLFSTLSKMRVSFYWQFLLFYWQFLLFYWKFLLYCLFFFLYLCTMKKDI